jgi:hypothetical protein
LLPTEDEVRHDKPEKSGRVSCDECEDERSRREHAAPAPSPDRELAYIPSPYKEVVAIGEAK